MKSLITSIFFTVLVLLFSSSASSSNNNHQNFLQCLSSYSNSSISKVIYPQTSSSYTSILQFTIQNLRYSTSSNPKPFIIITPLEASHIQSTIICSKKHNMQIRVRSGGHDFEGLSYVSNVPFVVIDLINFNNINIDVGTKTAWVQVGATIGEVYYQIAKKSKTLAFPGGVCSTIGMGGFIGGGGYGFLLRKYGLAADNVIDAHMIDVNGRFLDRKSMGEDLFWAIRGGGAASFGVVLEWKLKLVTVPPKVTMCNVRRTLEQNATAIINKWQHVAYKFPDDLYMRVILFRANSTQQPGKKTMMAIFESLYLGRIDQVQQILKQKLPELGAVATDCQELTWIESILYYAGFRDGEPLEALADRKPKRFFAAAKRFFKAKSDYVKTPIPENAWEGIFEKFYEKEGEVAGMLMSPYGGKMSKIAESAVPFPHRAGNLYKILYSVDWGDEGDVMGPRYIEWLRRLYGYMAPYVSQNPREAYVNYRDLDIGMNRGSRTSVKQASVWGLKYFRNNFYRLVQVKTKVDPTNFFKNEQSIPPLA